MEIKGAEYKALLGIKSILNTNRNVTILLEFWPVELMLCGSEACELLKLIDELGFDFKIINEQGEMKNKTSDYLSNTYGPEEDKWTNLVLMRK